MRCLGATLLVLVALAAGIMPGSAEMAAIVLLHGKTASPTIGIDGLTAALQGAGYLVDAPEMCWSRRRIYDRPLLDCLGEIDAAVARLRGRGAGRIVVAGMSQGGDAALVYGALRGDPAGIIAIAPAAPERSR
jgi:esterase/lipase